MSLFLGKIHFWLFNKILWFEGLEKEVIGLAGNLGMNVKKPFKTVWEKKPSDTEWRNITAFDISDHIKR